MEEAKRQSMTKWYGADDRNGCNDENGNKTAAKVARKKARRGSMLHAHKNEHTHEYTIHTIKLHTHEYRLYIYAQIRTYIV